MHPLERPALALLHRFDPETAHGLSLKALKSGLVGGRGPATTSRIKTEIAGLKLLNPIGLAAGYDKNCEVLAPLIRTGFGFLEVGAATPLAQDGNPRPRLYRLTEDQAVINRFGFNNEGAEIIAARLAKRPAGIPVGLNLGANKQSDDRAADYVRVLEMCGPHADFVTVNVSSPNTEKLRDLQGRDALSGLLSAVIEARDALNISLPVFLKIAPDLEDTEIEEIAEVALERKVDGVVATNTTLSRDGLTGPHASETGGLSGRPLFKRSTRVLARLHRATSGNIPLIGVGGVEDTNTAYAKIRAGASALQLYSALVYRGLSLIEEIAIGLDHRLKADGFSSVSEAVGTDNQAYLG